MSVAKIYSQTPRDAFRIIKLISKNPGMTTSQIKDELGLTARTIQRHTQALEDEGLIVNKNKTRHPCEWHWDL